MKLQVADYDTVAGYEVVREHNGNLTKLTTSVSENGTLTFETNQFSTYFIVKTAKKADNGNAKTEKVPIHLPQLPLRLRDLQIMR